MDHFWFKTNMFDIEPNEDEETNPRIYGKQFANWLNNQLIKIGYTETECFPDDYGWCIIILRKPFMLFVTCANVYDYDTSKQDDPPPSKDQVVWACSVMTELPFFRNLFKKIDTSPVKDKLCQEIEEILNKEPQIRLVDEP